MVSYACDGGGVGPHFDYYDVFLIQAEGKRRWRLGQQCDANSPLVPDSPMKILETFSTSAEHLAEPGDLLYVPTRTAHWGEAIGDSITLSIGFPRSHADVLLDVSADLASPPTGGRPLLGPKQRLCRPPGRINPKAVSAIEDILRRYTADRSTLAQWLAQYSTQLEQGLDDMYMEIDPESAAEGAICALSLYLGRAAYTDENNTVICYINGVGMPCSERLAQALCEYAPLSANDFGGEDRSVIVCSWRAMACSSPPTGERAKSPIKIER